MYDQHWCDFDEQEWRMHSNFQCKLGQNDDQLEEFWGCPEVSAYFTKHQEVCGLPQIDMDHTDLETTPK